MFDKLIESSRDKKQSRTGRIFFLTGLVYVMMMGVVAVATIMGLNPTLAESLSSIQLMPPVTPIESQPRPLNAVTSRTPTTPTMQATNVVPTQPVPIADFETINRFSKPIPISTGTPCTICRPSSSGADEYGSIIGDATVPPPPPKPRSTPEPAPEPKATPKSVLKVSSISPGLALRKVTPQYSAIARTAHASGPVQVQIMISEEGHVISAEPVAGHPLLRSLAVAAARQWLFKPTILNDVPVKVQGVLTFNFTLN